MDLLNKVCNNCQYKIKKIKNMNDFLDLFTLKEGREIKCPNCDAKYKTLKPVYYFGRIYNWFYLWVLSILFIISFLYSFDSDLGIRAWLYAILIYVVIELIVFLLLPLKQIKKKD